MCFVIKRHKTRQNHERCNVPTADYTSAHFKLSVQINVLFSILCGLCAFFRVAFQTELPTGNMVLCGIVPYEDDAN